MNCFPWGARSVFSIRFEFRNNVDFIHTFKWVDKNGDPVSLTGSSLRLHVKRNPKDAKPLLEMTSSNGLAVIDTEEPHTFTLKFPRYSLPPGNYVFDLKRIAGSEHLPLADGTIEVKPGVTT